MALEQELIELEKGFWRAAGNDGDFFREHMADDALAVMASGVMTKHDAVSSGEEAKPWTNIRIDHPKVMRFSEDTVALIYRGSAEQEGKPYSANIASIYVKQNGGWQLSLTHH
jgi:hypothetical protein